MTIHSIGLYLSNASNKNLILEQIISNKYLKDHINLESLKGLLHSTLTINRFIEDEIRHDKFPIYTSENKSLGSMSSGQQKKALLDYLILQRPDYIVLDDVYSNIDKATQESITNTLSQLAENTLLIQLFFRKRDMLPCIKTVYTVDENNAIIDVQDAEVFKTKQTISSTNQLTLNFPQGYDETHADINPLVQLNSVSVEYIEKPVLNKISWTIQKGEFWQLVGPNGSGKSTLLSIIIGDNPRGYGQDMVLFGKKKGSGESIWDIKRQIGYFTPAMIQQFTRDDTVENMIISGLMDSVGLYCKPTDIQKDIAKKWILMLSASYCNKSFQSLSIGQQRMVMVVRALVKHPPLLILDEPTIELDDENSLLFIDMINAIAKEKKITILYVSHRDEPGLKPDMVYELIPGKNGSTGIVR
ncbi:ABC transporter related protein [Paludibacter propionicigenes WB4]|uniref:ABC transporter related protein n=1 Tax=Paludibacter propionicigenes (strain DSM 17365 / JCM 13257 / WB4) TaxID=694427 RepID=E4T2F8_PALPW|nr:ATP-binding cassette domain-containing protein [Paludibacter propionicigenes]ADQ78902.1 ABC transporter related protein [Paludibacter propionicigenes WB4]